MKLTSALILIAQALSDLAQSARAYVQHVTGQKVPKGGQVPAGGTKGDWESGLSVIDDEELWERERDESMRKLLAESKKEFEDWEGAESGGESEEAEKA